MLQGKIMTSRVKSKIKFIDEQGDIAYANAKIWANIPSFFGFTLVNYVQARKDAQKMMIEGFYQKCPNCTFLDFEYFEFHDTSGKLLTW